MFLFPGNLLILARQKVASDGYLFAKGKSRSCSSQSESDDSSKAKRQKTDADQRAREITLLKENLSTLESRLKYKQQMIDKARSVSNYKQCDEISADIINVRKEKRNVERQLASIEKKQAKSEWYHSKKHKKSRNKKLEAKGGNLHQQGKSSSSVLHHFLTENNKTKEKNPREQCKDNDKSIPVDCDSASNASDDTIIIDENFQLLPPNREENIEN